jgi:glycosyltransferase involved in cell wall biosynthesis
MGEPRALWVSTNVPGCVATYVRTIQQTQLWTDWNIRHVATHRGGSAWAKIGAFARGAMLFVFELIRFRPSLVHLHAAADASFVRKGILFWISQLAGVPVVLHIHDSGFPEYYDNSPRAIQAIIRATFCRASAVVALSDAWATRLRVIAPTARITVIPNAVQLGRRVTQPPRGEPVHMVFLGRIGTLQGRRGHGDHKGAFRLLEAWAQLARDPGSGAGCRKAATLTIAGDGEVERARRRIRELRLEDTVELREWLSESDVDELLNGSHVLVLPSRNEGQSMAVLEAMARGLCVIASDAGGLPDMIGGGHGVIVPPDDIDAIADASRLVIEDRDLRARYGAAAYARVEAHFDVRAVRRRIDALYREVSR